MSLTPEQIQRNRDSAARLAMSNLGLTGVPLSEWTQSERVAYDHALAAIIAKYPADFSAQDLVTAQDVQAKSVADAQLEDASFSLTDFGGAVVDNAVAIESKINPLDPANVGGFASWLKWLAVAAVIVAVLAYVLPTSLAKAAAAKAVAKRPKTKTA